MKQGASEKPMGSDPMDRYSIPLSTEPIVGERGKQLGMLITLTRRASSEKPGRTLSVGWDARLPLVPGFTNVYAYTMRFQVADGAKGIPAGRHYHEDKNEIFRSVIGRFRVVLEDIETGERSVLELDSSKATSDGEQLEQFIYVPTRIAHAVLPLSEGESALEVIANHPNVAGDEFPYDMEV